MPSRIGRYEISGRLGAGGMGVVYLATDPMLRRTVAIKVLPGEDDADLRERFLREARSVAALRHANVVTIYDIGEEQGRLFIAMERIEGQSMAELIDSRAPLSLDRRLELMLDLCAGLGYAHKQGIIHRDIKPGNLMITSEGPLKVLDFGLARAAAANSETGLTRSGALVGTPNYMSPEQVMGVALDQRSDIFSVGLVLYELLSYRRAFSGESIHTILHDIVYNQPAPIRELLPSLDAELVAIVDKAIDKDPARRYPSLSSLAADLDRVRKRVGTDAADATLILDDGETILLGDTRTVHPPRPAPPPPPPAASRARLYAAGAAAVMLLAIVAFVYSIRQPADPVSGEPPPTTTPAPAGDTAPPVAAEPPPVPAAPVAGAQQVTIDMMPWARVRIVPVGHEAQVPAEPLLTPFVLSLAPGAYRLECENGGVSQPTSIPITVEAGKPLAVTRTMRGFDAAQVVETLVGPRPSIARP